MSDVLVDVEGVSKRFCRGLKRSLWYGVCDMAAELTGRRANDRGLRPAEFWAVHDVSFQLRRGECLGLIGPNGAGKSTLLKMLNGLIKPDSGRMTIRGRMGALIQLGAGFHPLLTGRENIYVNGAILGMSRREITRRFDDIVAFSGLQDALDRPVSWYSSGMYARLGFSVAAHLDPDILLVDEVLSVGDLEFMGKCFNRIGDLKERGTVIIFVSHQVHTVQRLCSRAMVLSRGACTPLLPVAKAVIHYNQLSLTDGNPHGAPVNCAEDVLLTRFDVFDQYGNEIWEDLRERQRVRIRVHYERRNAVVATGILFEMRFYSAGVLVATINSEHNDLAISQLHANGIIEIETELPLAAGVYIVDGGFRPANKIGLIGWARQLGTLTVQGRGYVEGIVALTYDMRHIDNHGCLTALQETSK